MHKNYDISVVVTTYNSQDTIENCLISIINQIDIVVEIIIVDFNSSDNTLKIIDQVCKHHKKDYTVIYQKNPGLGTARNIGLEKAKAEYVAFMDADDYIAVDAYKKMLWIAKSEFIDLIICQADVFHDNSLQLMNFFYDDLLFGRITDQSIHFCNFRGLPALFALEPNACRKIYRRQFLLENNITFPDGVSSEDLEHHYQCIINAFRICLVKERLFYYRVGRKGKLTNSPARWIDDLIKANQKALAIVKQAGIDEHSGGYVVYLFVRALIGYGLKIKNKKKRLDIFIAVSLLFEQVPNEWISSYYRYYYSRENLYKAVILRLLQQKEFLLVDHMENIRYSSVNFLNLKTLWIMLYLPHIVDLSLLKRFFKIIMKKKI